MTGNVEHFKEKQYSSHSLFLLGSLIFLKALKGLFFLTLHDLLFTFTM